MRRQPCFLFSKWYLFIVCYFFIFGKTAIGQANFIKTPAVGVHLIYMDFNGAKNLKNFGGSMKTGVALNFQNNLSKRFDYSITLAGAFLEFPDKIAGNTTGNAKQLLLENDFAMRVHWLRSPALFNPFVLTGAGWSQYNSRFGMYVPVGLGMQVNITPDLFLLVNTQYRLAVTTSQHQHFFHSIGFAGAITHKRIVKKAPAPMPVLVAQQVTPVDTDGDGIVDNLDSCPQVAGVARYNGCPAPDTIRLATSTGSLPIEALKTIVDRAARQIFFETGSYRLLPQSFPSLDTVAHILKENQALQIAIEGHTDNVGAAADNQLLSKNRANTVMEYLVNVGIQASRLQATGYGQQQPVAPNTTPEGRAANRRVVLQVHY